MKIRKENIENFNYPKNVYVASVDPMHFSHLNTKRTAEEIIGETVNLIICQNELKEECLFSLEERREIAKLYLNNEHIFLARNREEIKKFLLKAKKVVRGIRNNKDIEYTKKLAKHYDVENLWTKLILIPVPDEYKKISSSRLKNLAKKESSDLEFYAPKKVLDIIKDKFLSILITK